MKQAAAVWGAVSTLVKPPAVLVRVHPTSYTDNYYCIKVTILDISNYDYSTLYMCVCQIRLYFQFFTARSIFRSASRFAMVSRLS